MPMPYGPTGHPWALVSLYGWRDALAAGPPFRPAVFLGRGPYWLARAAVAGFLHADQTTFIEFEIRGEVDDASARAAGYAGGFKWSEHH